MQNKPRFGNQEGEFYNYQKEIPTPERFIDVEKTGNISRQNIPAPPEDVSGLQQHPMGNLQGEDPAYQTILIPPCGILDIDKSVKRLFNETIKFPTKAMKGVSKKYSLTKPMVNVAGGDKSALAKKIEPLRADDGALILPAISIRRTSIDYSLAVQNSRGITSGTGEIVVKVGLDSERDPLYQNLINKLGLKNRPTGPTSRRRSRQNRNDLSIREGSFLDPKTADNTLEYLVMPSPTFVDVSYEIVLWTENILSMNSLLECILAAKLPLDNGFVLATDANYWFVGYLGDQISMEDNFEDYTENEKIVKTRLELKVKAFLLPPNEDTNMYPIKRYVTAVSFDFDIKQSSYKIYSKTLIDQIGIKQNQDAFLLSDVEETEAPKAKTSDQNLYFEKELINGITGKRERVYAEVMDNTQSKETVYRASSIDEVLALISKE
jgi:hypothetical protein